MPAKKATRPKSKDQSKLSKKGSKQPLSLNEQHGKSVIYLSYFTALLIFAYCNSIHSYWSRPYTTEYSNDNKELRGAMISAYLMNFAQGLVIGLLTMYVGMKMNNKN